MNASATRSPARTSPWWYVCLALVVTTGVVLGVVVDLTTGQDGWWVVGLVIGLVEAGGLVWARARTRRGG